MPIYPPPALGPPPCTLVCAYPSSWQAFSSVRSSVSLSDAVKCKKQSKLIASQSEPLTQLRQRTFHTHTERDSWTDMRYAFINISFKAERA